MTKWGSELPKTVGYYWRRAEKVKEITWVDEVMLQDPECMQGSEWAGPVEEPCNETGKFEDYSIRHLNGLTLRPFMEDLLDHEGPDYVIVTGQLENFSMSYQITGSVLSGIVRTSIKVLGVSKDQCT